MGEREEIVIVTGPRDSGKTTWCRTNLRDLDGVFSIKAYQHDQHIGYDALRAGTAKTVPLLRLRSGIADTAGTERNLFGIYGNTTGPTRTIGKYLCIDKGFTEAESWIMNAIDIDSHDIVIDEVGKLESKGEGFAQAVRRLVESNLTHRVILVVRDRYVNTVCDTFGITHYKAISV